MTPPPPPPHVVIVGGGFAGLHAAFTLARARVRITLVDRRNHHLFAPLLYQVATAGLNPSDIAVPIRRILRRQRNVRVILREATGCDLDRRSLRTKGGDIEYDFLILAAGSRPFYFSRPEWAGLAQGLSTLPDALEIRRRILLAYEQAEVEEDEARRRALMTFIIIGGGPTGVELAGAVAEMARHALAHDFRQIDPRQARIVVLDGADRILGAYSQELSLMAVAQLERLGVEVRTSTRVSEVDADGVWIGLERIPARTVLWAAGVRGSPLAETLGTPLTRDGRIEVQPDLSVPGHPEVFVAGDLSGCKMGDRHVPGLAPAAIQMGRHAARNILLRIRNEPTLPFEYKNRGTMATIGRAAAIADLGFVQLSGFWAWVAWLVVHILFLIGFRNRFLVLFEWAYAYFTYERGVRLIPENAREEGENGPRAPDLGPRG